MIFLYLAKLVIIIHLFYILFAILGGLLISYNKKIAYIHIPSLLWIAFNQFAGWPCPLTWIEKWLYYQAHVSMYNGGFIEHYILPVLGADNPGQVNFTGGIIILVLNIVLYGYVWYKNKNFFEK